MLHDKARLLHETLRRYVRREAWGRITTVLGKTRDEALAEVMDAMSDRHQAEIWTRLPDDIRRANVITLMKPPFGQTVLDALSPERAAAILREMADDDAADILADLRPELSAGVLEILDRSEEVEELMGYGHETAGGIMVPEYLALSADATAEEALATLREAGDVEMVYYIYVVSDSGVLVGVLSLRKLVTAPPATQIHAIMETDVISVSTHTDQEAVAQLVSRYGFLSVPVVDDSNNLVGIVTVDDVLDVLRVEATEDILRMAGAGANLAETNGVRGNLRIRFPWLLASCGGGILAAMLMSLYEHTLETHSFLALFLPVILGMSGNVGTQSSTVTVRGLAVGQIRHYDGGWGVVRKEVSIGLLLGLAYGLIVGLASMAFEGGGPYPLAIGFSIAAGMTVAATVGAAVPLALSRFNIDPAVATGPMVTTCVDVLGILVYFNIAALLTHALT